MVGKRKVNRKKQQAMVFPVPLAATLVVAAGLALSYLWLCGRCEALGREIKQTEQRKEQLHRDVLNEEYKWTNMRSLRNIRATLHHFNIQMDWPDERAVVYLSRDLDADQIGQTAQVAMQLARTSLGEVHD